MKDIQNKHDIDKSNPFLIFLNKVKKISSNVQKNMEFLFILKGALNIIINNQCYSLKESDIVLINNGDIYEINGDEENLVLSMQIDYDFFASIVKNSQNLYLCNSSLGDSKKYDAIRKILAKVMYEYSNKEYSYEYQIMAQVYNLIYILNTEFLLADSQEIQSLESKNSKYDQRVNDILSYIKQNYYQQISLQDVANAQYLSPEYLSRFFKSYMGMTFSRYINEYRLTQAVKELMRTDNPVTKVAMNNGFPNLVAFNKIFKEVYNTTPAEYRNKIRKKQSVNGENEEIDSEVTKVDYNQVLEQLTKYVEENEVSREKSESIKGYNENAINIEVDSNEKKAISHTWRNLINLGYASDGLRSDLQQHLTYIQNSIKFKYARFQGIFSADMLSEEGDEGGESYNFSKIDKLIDFLHSIGLKPFIELGNKAKVLNLVSDKIMYFKNHSNKQKNFKENLELLEKFIIHCVNRYGIDEVSEWYFDIWKEGDVNHIFWSGNFDKYLNVFESYYKVIKNIVPNAKIGGPGINPEININLLENLMDQWKKRGITPDFLSVYLYANELIEDSNSKSSKKINSENKNIYKSELLSNLSHLLLTKDKNYTKVTLDKIRKIVSKCEIDIGEIHVTEWNSTISHRQPPNDTTFKAAFIVKNIIDNLDETKSFGYWLASDISGELKDSKTLLFGEMGLISATGIKKPGFYAYDMLARLGSKLIDKGDGYIVTSKSSYNYEVITYNYKHFDRFYCLNEETTINYDQYYNIFEDQDELNLNINLKGIKKGRYRIKKYALNRSHGSIFDEWLKMNAIYNIKKDEIDYLKQICVPEQTISYIENVEELKIESHLEPHEVNLYEITFEYN